MPTCPICASSQRVKNGRIHNNKQRFKWLDCGRQFLEQLTKKAIDFRHTGTDWPIVECIFPTRIARAAQVSEQWLLSWSQREICQAGPKRAGNTQKKGRRERFNAIGAVLHTLSDSKTSYRRAIQQYIEATGVSASPKNLVLFKIVGESQWCHLVFHSSLQCIITCVALPILCGGF